MAFSSTLMASFSCSLARPCSPVQVSLASSSSVFISCGGRALVSPWSLRQVVRRRTGGDGRSRGLDCRCIFGLGVPELVVIAGVAALVFGPKKLPEIGRSIGKTVKSFQQAAKEFESELKKEPETITQPATSEKTNGSVEASRAVKSEEDKELEVTGTKESP